MVSKFYLLFSLIILIVVVTLISFYMHFRYSWRQGHGEPFVYYINVMFFKLEEIDNNLTVTSISQYDTRQNHEQYHKPIIYGFNDSYELFSKTPIEFEYLNARKKNKGDYDWYIKSNLAYYLYFDSSNSLVEYIGLKKWKLGHYKYLLNQDSKAARSQLTDWYGLHQNIYIWTSVKPQKKLRFEPVNYHFSYDDTTIVLENNYRYYLLADSGIISDLTDNFMVPNQTVFTNVDFRRYYLIENPHFDSLGNQ